MSRPAPEPKTGLSAPWWWTGFILLAHVFGRAIMKYRYEIRPTALPKPAILASKHVSYWDVPLASTVVRHRIRTYPHWEMASFHGYPVLGKMLWVLRKWGGFPVMRPKDLMRLKKPGMSKDDLRAIMKRVNDEAARTRDAVLRRGEVLCFFPEGTRSKTEVKAFRSIHEIEEGVALAEEGIEAPVLPVAICYGKKPRFTIPWLVRRPVTIKVLDPVPLKGRDAREALEEVRDAVVAAWEPSPASS